MSIKDVEKVQSSSATPKLDLNFAMPGIWLAIAFHKTKRHMLTKQFSVI